MTRHLLKYAAAVLPLLVAAAGCSSEADPTSSTDEDALSRQCSAKVPDPARGTVQGIDVSRHQGTVDWDKVLRSEPNLKFAVARVSDGLSVIDGAVFTRNYAEIGRVGLRRGAYQFLRPDQDAAAQARLFIDTVKAAGGFTRGDIPPTVDIEVSSGMTPQKVQQAVRTWLTMVQEELHVHPIVYSLAGVSDSLGGCFTNTPLWIANFYQKCPKMPTAWTEHTVPWTFFQYVDNAHIGGISTTIDRDVFNGTESEFVQFVEAAADHGDEPVALAPWRCTLH